MNLTDLFLSSKGRISRKTFWIGAGLLVVWSILVFVVLWSILGPSLIQNFLGRLVGFAFTLLDDLFRLQSRREAFQRSGSPDHLRAGRSPACGRQVAHSICSASPATCMRRTGSISFSCSSAPASRSGISSSSA